MLIFPGLCSRGGFDDDAKRRGAIAGGTPELVVCGGVEERENNKRKMDNFR